MAMSAEHRSKFLALHQQWWHLQMSEKFSSGTKNPEQTNILNVVQISKYKVTAVLISANQSKADVHAWQYR